MSWTYRGDPQNDPMDELRFLIGDVNETPESLTDAEILYMLGQRDGNVYAAAADSAERMSVRFAAKAATSKSVGDLTLSYNHTQTSQHYIGLAVRLRSGKAGSMAKPRFWDDKPNAFGVGMDDHATGWKNERLL